MLAIRTEVVEEGPWSREGLLPIPADRTRSEPLPGDTVELSAFVASADGVVPDEVLDPAWFLCPSGPCLSELRFPGAEEACGDVLPDEVPCSLPRGARSRFLMPGLDPEVPLAKQLDVRVAFVARAVDGPSTERCIELIVDSARPSREGCIVAYHRIVYGPLTRLMTLVLEEGIELPEVEFEVEQLELPIQPHFNPEFAFLRLAPVFEGVEDPSWRTVDAYPDQVTVLEPGYAYVFERTVDPRDSQVSLRWSEDGFSTSRRIEPDVTTWTDTPGIYGEFRGREALLRAPVKPGRFTLFGVVVSDRGIGWATFPFEVREP